MKAYKGFDRNMRCRGFQFEEGNAYTEVDAKLCKTGFHACEAPIDCLNYYAPSNSVYHEVELDDVAEERSNDSKVCGKKIRIGARLTIGKMVVAQVEYVKEHAVKKRDGHSIGHWSANSATGDGSANSATGNWSANSATGYWSANSATGNWSANSATGYGSANSATGNWSANSATGYGSANVSTGKECQNEGSAGSISIGWGKGNMCKGTAGAYLVLCERGEWDGTKYPLIGEPVLLKVDGEMVKENVWYTLKGGSVVEVNDE